MIWRDDGSSDKSKEIVREFKNLSKIECEHFDHNLGVTLSYSHLLSHAKGYDIIAFCDQDDIWHSIKLETAKKHILDSKEKYNIYASRIEIMNSKEDWPPTMPKLTFTNSLFENLLIGCTIVIDSETLQMLERYPCPKELLYDSWLYSLSFCSLEIYYDYSPMVKYRVHSNNDTGLNAANWNVLFKYFKRLVSIIDYRKRVRIKLFNLQKISELGSLNASKINLILGNGNFSSFQRLLSISKLEIRQNNLENLLVKLLLITRVI